MPRLKQHFGFCLAFACSGLLALGDSSANPSSAGKGATETLSLSAWVEPGEFVGDEQLRRLYINAGTNRFGFMVPSGLRVDTSGEDRVTLTQPHYDFYLTLKFLPASDIGDGDANLRARLEHLFPGGVITEETVVEALSRRALLFKLRWRSAEELNRTVLVAFARSPGGLLELSLVANPQKIVQGQNVVIDLLQRARSNENSPLKMPVYKPVGYN